MKGAFFRMIIGLHEAPHTLEAPRSEVVHLRLMGLVRLGEHYSSCDTDRADQGPFKTSDAHILIS